LILDDSVDLRKLYSRLTTHLECGIKLTETVLHRNITNLLIEERQPPVMSEYSIWYQVVGVLSSWACPIPSWRHIIHAQPKYWSNHKFVLCEPGIA
jgi:hypothetical protein